MRRVLLIVFALASLGASTARAQAPLDLDAAPDPFPAIGQKALAAAAVYWGADPCPNGVRELPATEDQLGASMASGRCVIFWDPKVAPTTPLEWCTRVIHEDGHLLGYGHTANPWDAMYGGPRITVGSGPFRAQSSSDGFCYGHGFYRTWRRRGVLAT